MQEAARRSQARPRYEVEQTLKLKQARERAVSSLGFFKKDSKAIQPLLNSTSRNIKVRLTTVEFGGRPGLCGNVPADQPMTLR